MFGNHIGLHKIVGVCLVVSYRGLAVVGNHLRLSLLLELACSLVVLRTKFPET